VALTYCHIDLYRNDSPQELDRARVVLEAVAGEAVNKSDLVEKIAGACEISKAQAATAVDTAVESITGALRKGDRVALIGFGTFSVSKRKARNGRNIQTGATIKIVPRKVARFTPGSELKKAVNKELPTTDPFVTTMEELSEYYS